MSLTNKRILITAGPTREPMDPVRFLTNPSSGEMGFQLAKVLQKKGARVTLVYGPTWLKAPTRIKFIPVTTALQMAAAVKKEISKSDVFIATAAVSDFRFAHISLEKLKKGHRKAVRVTLLKNPDILKEVGQWKLKHQFSKPILVGFALETKKLRAAARKKLKEKNLDLIIGNSPSSFSTQNIRPYWLERNKLGAWLPVASKEKLAHRISDWLNKKCNE